MMAKTNIFIIYLGLMITLVLSILPIPNMLQVIWPEWTALIILYWALARPDVIGMGHAWFIGIFLDVLRNTLLGVHGLGLVCMVFPMLNLRLRMRIFPIAQQTLIVFLVFLLYQAIITWIRTLVGHPPQSSMHWLSPVVTSLFWPLLSLFDHRYIQQ